MDVQKVKDCLKGAKGESEVLILVGIELVGIKVIEIRKEIGEEGEKQRIVIVPKETEVQEMLGKMKERLVGKLDCLVDEVTNQDEPREE